MVRRRSSDEDAAEGTTPGRKLPGVKDPIIFAISSRGNPTSAASQTVPHPQHKISVHSLHVSIGLRRLSSESPPSTVVASVVVSVLPRQLGKVVTRPSKRARDTRQPVGTCRGDQWPQDCISAPNRQSVPSPPIVYCVSSLLSVVFIFSH